MGLWGNLDFGCGVFRGRGFLYIRKVSLPPVSFPAASTQ
nr:MAG TPA: hypothetical protein [Caudoviricetes sp.]